MNEHDLTDTEPTGHIRFEDGSMAVWIPEDVDLDELGIDWVD